MFGLLTNVVRGCVSFVSGASKKVKTVCAVCFGTLLAANASAQSALDGFISTDATTGDPVADPSKITTFIKSIVVNTYSNWITVALIFVVVGLMCWILFKKK